MKNRKTSILITIIIAILSQKIYSQYYKIELVKDILPGNIGSTPQDLVKAGNNLYFVANDGIHGREMWKSDGTAAGTQMVMDINPNGSASGEPGDLITVGDNVFFRASDGSYGFELWRSQFNGVGAGLTTMVKDINPFGSSTPLYLVNTNGTLKFAANNGLNGEELWHSDGSTMGTFMVEDLEVGAAGTRPNGLSAVNNRVFFRTLSFPGLFSANSIGINGPLEVTTYNDEDISPNNFAKINTTLFFSGIGNSIFLDAGRELFSKEDGGEPVKLRKDINIGPDSSNPSLLTPVGSTLYFVANKGANIGLWKTGELSEASEVKAFPAGTTISKLIGVNSLLYFFISTGGETQLWRSSGTLATTVLVKTLNNNMLFQMPTDAIDFNGRLIFSILHPINGIEIWQSGGDDVNTSVIRDLNPGPNSAEPNHFAVVNDMLFFTADNGINGNELYKMYSCYGSQNFTVKNGNWGDTDTWNCGRVPITTEQITIKGHTINVNGSFGIQKITFEGGNITMPVGSTLTYYPIVP